MKRDVVCADARETYDERDQNLEEAGKYETLLCLVDALGCKTFLDDVLVEAPVTEVGEPYAADHSRNTRHVGKCAFAVALLDDKVEVAVVEVVTGSEVVEDVAETGECSFSSAYSGECEERGDETAAHEEYNLEHVSPCHRCKSSVD